MSVEVPAPRHIRLTSHAGGAAAPALVWGAASATERGPVVGTTTQRAHRNVIGTHSGSYGVYRALAVAAGALDRHQSRPDQHRAHRPIGPYPQWNDPGRIVSLDPWGAEIGRHVFAAELAPGYDIRPRSR
jgi:hypothetical protein